MSDPTTYTWFLFVEAFTPTTHILAWDPAIRKWVIPCGTIPRPHRDRVTYAPAKPLCQTCTRLTRQTFDRDHDSRTRNR